MIDKEEVKFYRILIAGLTIVIICIIKAYQYWETLK